MNSDLINSDIVMIGSNKIDYYESNNILSIASIGYVEEMLNFLEKQRETILENYKSIFMSEYITENNNPIVVHEVQLFNSPVIVYRFCGICVILLVFVVATIISTILFLCKKNKKSVNVIKAEPLIVNPIEIKNINV